MSHGKEKLKDGQTTEAVPEWTICAYLNQQVGHLGRQK
jgi:hypothetical protein